MATVGQLPPLQGGLEGVMVRAVKGAAGRGDALLRGAVRVLREARRETVVLGRAARG